MTVEFAPHFAKDLTKLHSPFVKKYLVQLIQTCEHCHSISEIPNVKKLKGTEHSYRIRYGRYRFGFELLENNTIRFVAVYHRKDFYKYFPKLLFHFLFQNL